MVKLPTQLLFSGVYVCFGSGLLGLPLSESEILTRAAVFLPTQMI